MMRIQEYYPLKRSRETIPDEGCEIDEITHSNMGENGTEEQHNLFTISISMDFLHGDN